MVSTRTVWRLARAMGAQYRQSVMIRSSGGDAATLRDLRRARQARRLGDTEWFDVLYRVYLFGLGGLIVVVWASDALAGLLEDEVPTSELLRRGPSIAGIAVALAFAVGLRNGADGGPVSVESADVRHLLLSPVSRRLALMQPVLQRLRAVCFVPAVALAILGQLVAREVEGSRAAWAASSFLFGVVVGCTYVGVAVIAHALRLSRVAASVIGGVVLVWQVADAVTTWTASVDGDTRPLVGPADLPGSLLFWGVRQRGIDVAPVVAAVAITVAAVLLCGRLRLEPLERRGQLVSQLRFAATVQDIRTVVLLRRQLRAESVRTRPWFRVGAAPSIGPASRPITRAAADGGEAGAAVVWKRGLVSLSRLPISRVARMCALGAIAGASASLVVTSTFLFAVPLVGALFLLGLEAAEPLAQEIDRPDLTDSFPVDRGILFSRHLAAPAALLAVVAMIGAGAATLVEPRHAAAAFALAVPITWAGSIGAIVSTVRDAPDPAVVASTTLSGRDRSTDSPFALPEFAGASNIMTGLVPIVLSAVSVAPVAAMRDEATVGTALRSAVGVGICLAAMVWWIRRRDAWAIKLRGFFAEGRAAA